MKQILLAVLVSLIFFGCGSKPIPYQANTDMSQETSIATAERIVRNQSANTWKPNHFEITADTIIINDKSFHYKSVSAFRIYDYNDGFLVNMMGYNNKLLARILYTNDLETAQLLVDAMSFVTVREITDIKDALQLAESLIISQHRNWAPDAVYFTPDFIALDYGTQVKTQTSGFATASTFNNSSYLSNTLISGFSSTNAQYNHVKNKIFYKEISDITTRPWRRKFKLWYLTDIYKYDGRVIHLLYTRDERKANDLKSALDYIRNYAASNKTTVDDTEPSTDTQSNNIHERLESLKKMREDNLITEEQYRTKQAEILNDL